MTRKEFLTVRPAKRAQKKLFTATVERLRKEMKLKVYSFVTVRNIFEKNRWNFTATQMSHLQSAVTFTLREPPPSQCLDT